MNTLIKSSAGAALAFAVALAPMFSFAQLEVELNATGSTGGIDSASDISATLSDSVIEVDVSQATDTDEAADTEAASDQDERGAGFGALMLNAEGIAVIAASQVEADADLEAFQHNLAADHENVEAVRIDTDAEGETEVAVHYNHSGRLFGFMPVTVRSTTVVTISADGAVDIDSNVPWWSLVVTRIDHAEGEIESRIRDNPTVMMNAESELSARGKAEIAEAIIAELQAHTSLHAALRN